MCLNCYEEHGSPAIDNERVRATSQAIGKVYEFSAVGGNLHIAIDDWNIEDDDLDFCANSIATNTVHRADVAQLAAERACLELLRGLTKEERVSALAMQSGFLEVTD